MSQTLRVSQRNVFLIDDKTEIRNMMRAWLYIVTQSEVGVWVGGGCELGTHLGAKGILAWKFVNLWSRI